MIHFLQISEHRGRSRSRNFSQTYSRSISKSPYRQPNSSQRFTLARVMDSIPASPAPFEHPHRDVLSHQRRNLQNYQQNSFDDNSLYGRNSSSSQNSYQQRSSSVQPQTRYYRSNDMSPVGYGHSYSNQLTQSSCGFIDRGYESLEPIPVRNHSGPGFYQGVRRRQISGNRRQPTLPLKESKQFKQFVALYSYDPAKDSPNSADLANGELR